MPAATPLDAALPDARRAAADFLLPLDRAARVVVFCHFDADGLAAGALLGRTLTRLGFTNVRVVPSARGESAFSAEARSRLATLDPAALIVADLGIDPAGVLPDVPTLYVDHHQWSAAPPGAVVVSGYRWDPIPTSSWLAFELLAPLADIDDLGWIGAVGAIGDLGEKAPWERLPGIRKRHTAKWLKEAVALVNAARRAPAFDVGTPLVLLMRCDSPRELAERDDLGADRLRGYRAEVNAELAIARRAAPRFASGGSPFALVRLHSAAQIHPLVAQQWRGRLPGFAVIAANTGYLPGAVAFSVRTGRADLNLPLILQSVDLGDATGSSYGHGHDRASGGHLPTPLFARLLLALGFDPAIAASMGDGTA